MSASDNDLVAAFLAKGGAVKTVDAAPAFGVDPAADKARREARRYEENEQEADRRRDLAHDAFRMGDREEGYAQMTGFRRVASGRYVRS